MCHFLQREGDELGANAITQHLLSTSVSAAFWNLYLIMWICVSHYEYGTLEQPTAHCMWNVTLIFCLGIYDCTLFIQKISDHLQQHWKLNLCILLRNCWSDPCNFYLHWDKSRLAWIARVPTENVDIVQLLSLISKGEK